MWSEQRDYGRGAEALAVGVDNADTNLQIALWTFLQKNPASCAFLGVAVRD